MSATDSKSNEKHGRKYMMAVVLGTAITAFGTASKSAATEISEKTVADITRYCTTCWRNARLPVDQWVDCTQEVFKRLLMRVPAQAWQFLLIRESAERRELIRAVDAVKKRCHRAQKNHSPITDVLPDTKLAPDQHRSDQRTAVDSAARECLTSRQQSILQLSFDGWTVRDIAGEMDISAQRVSDEKYKAIRKLQTVFSV